MSDVRRSQRTTRNTSIKSRDAQDPVPILVTGLILALTAVTARSVALAGFGLDSLIEIGASTVVIWELSGGGQGRQRRALRLIGAAFGLLALYLAVQSTVVLAVGFHPHHSPVGIGWTAVAALVMFVLAVPVSRAC